LDLRLVALQYVQVTFIYRHVPRTYVLQAFFTVSFFKGNAQRKQRWAKKVIPIERPPFKDVTLDELLKICAVAIF
jgi:hypothetical protein